MEPYARVAVAMVLPVVEAHAAGRLQADPRHAAVSDGLRAAVAPVAESLFAGVPVGTVVAAIEAWTTIVGAVSLEVFGHWRNTVLDPGQLFDATARSAAAAIGLH